MKFYVFSLPLLTKELIEQSQHLRTYVLRTVYAVLLYGAALFQYWQIVGAGGAAGLSRLGSGGRLLEMLWIVQSVMILLLLPPMTCGALTVEKEKDTLALLLLTKLSPWTIIFEKYLSRVFAIATFQFLSLPLFGIAYGLGGVEVDVLISAVLSQFALSLLVASVSILCSTWFRTTAAAFVSTYAILALLMGLTPAFRLVVPSTTLMFMGLRPRFAITPGFAGLSNPQFLVAALGSFAFLVLSVNLLVRRAFVPQRNLILDLFLRADRFFSALNEATTGGVILVREEETLPQFAPIAWRETRKKSLGTFRYQFRILMLLLTPLFIAIALILTESASDFESPFRLLASYFWVVSIFCISLHATGAIPSERIRQTLDVLLVTPLTVPDMVQQKLAGVQRLIRVLTVPFAVLVVFQAIWTGYILGRFRSIEFWMELAITTASVLIYMPFIMWLGFQFGLRMRNQIQAIITTLGLVSLLCVIPLWVGFSIGNYVDEQGFSLFEISNMIGNVIYWMSPAAMVLQGYEIAQEIPPFESPAFWQVVYSDIFTTLGVICHYSLFVAAIKMLRKNATTSFSRIVRRLEA